MNCSVGHHGEYWYEDADGEIVCSMCRTHGDAVRALESALAGEAAALDELASLGQWVADLQSGMFINCVYCGHRYGPNDEVPASMAQVLKDHIEVCSEHPMSKLKEELNEKSRRYRIEVDRLREEKDQQFRLRVLSDIRCMELEKNVAKLLDENETR